jgi:hypothetical protein
MIALVILLFRLMIMFLVMTARLTYWMLKAVVVLVAAAAASISASSASRQRRPVRRG